jgi:hypothetical protein
MENMSKTMNEQINKIGWSAEAATKPPPENLLNYGTAKRNL